MLSSVKSMTNTNKLKVCCSLLPILWNVSATANNNESLATIKETAEQFAVEQIDRADLSNIEARANNLDKRLKLAKCETPLEAFNSGSTGNLARTTIGVRCLGPKPWTLYVPVRISATADAVFTLQPLTRGEGIEEEHLEIRQVPFDQLPRNYFSTFEPLLDKQLRQSLRAQIIVTANAVAPKEVVQRGQEIIILANGKNIQVRMNGIALDSGASGELVSVRNTNSGRTIEATIIDAGTVSVKM